MNLRPVISPELDFQFFCAKMVDRNPVTAMESASAEVSYSRTNHREQTGQSDFRKGSKGQRYCDHLKALIRMLMNGKMPENPDPAFVSAVSPMMRRFLTTHRIGDLNIRLFQEPP